MMKLRSLLLPIGIIVALWILVKGIREYKRREHERLRQLEQRTGATLDIIQDVASRKVNPASVLRHLLAWFMVLHRRQPARPTL